MTQPPVQLLAPGVVLLTGDGVDALAFAVQIAQRARRRNGQPPSQALAALAAAAAGQTDVTPEPNANNEIHNATDWLTTEEAAQMLECSNRQARRLAPTLGGKLHAGRWLLDRQAVTEHIQGRTAA